MSELQAGLAFIFAVSAIALLAASTFLQQGWTWLKFGGHLIPTA